MTGELTREQAVDTIQGLEVLISRGVQSVYLDMALAGMRQLLAAMDSEPHTDDELSNLLWYSQEAACHSDPNYFCEFQRLATPGFIASIIRELQERRKADSEQVALQPELAKVIYHFRDWNEGFPVERFKADYVISWMLANYPPAQPAPVVPDDYQHLKNVSELYNSVERKLFALTQRVKPAFDTHNDSCSDAIRVLEQHIFGILTEDGAAVRQSGSQEPADGCGYYDMVMCKRDTSEIAGAVERYMPNQATVKQPSSNGKSELLQRAEKLAEDTAALVERVGGATCAWGSDDSGTWSGSCGVEWQFFDDGPIENSMNFCPGCGKPVSVK